MALVARLANGAAALLGAGTLSQFPEYYQQYLQRLGGRLDQALVQEARYYQAAADAGLTMDEYIARFTTTSDEVIQNEGWIIQAALDDAQNLREALIALTNAGTLERPFTFFQHLDQATLSAAFDSFAPALPLSTEGLAYAAVGMVAGLISWAGCERCGRSAVFHMKRWRERRARETYDI